ncbi:a-factor receptor [Rhodosporidiobolus nylandii]
MGVWVVLMNANEFINAVVWYHDAVDRAPVWCDISIKIGLGGQVGRLAAVFCISRFLADVVSPRATAITRQDRRRRAVYDYLVSFGVPILLMACHIVYQGNRYIVQRSVGCTATQFLSWPTLVLRMIWGPVFAVGGVVYSAGAHSALTTTRFIRLAVLSISYLLIGVPLTLYSTIINIRTSGRYYDYSWTYFRKTWHEQPVVLIDTPGTADLASWSNVIVAVIFFAAFGFGTEATELYKKAVRPCFGRRGQGSSPPSSHSVWSSVKSFLLRRPRTTVGAQDDVPAIRICTKDLNARSHSLGGVKVVVEKEENIV